MKSNVILAMLLLFFLLAGCDEISIDAASSPEDALKTIETGNKEREITVYGSHQVNEALVLIVFQGVMNNKDIWVADVRKANGQWKAEEVVQMNGPFEGKGDTQTIITNEEFGYEIGYIDSDVPEADKGSVIEVDGVEEWKIWIKESL
jgi:hypothetical protein